jgi:hypothetical protein
MADPEHLKLIRRGPLAWNSAKPEQPDLTRADLRKVVLTGADLTGADLTDANLSGVRIFGANLGGAFLHRANLYGASLPKANLHKAGLRHANLGAVDLSGADLRLADLSGADVSGANLRGANLIGAVLFCTNLTKAIVNGADISQARVELSSFVDIDLSDVSGLDSLNHSGPSSIGIDTLYKSGGKIPEEFLRGCGVPDDFITYARSLVSKAWDFYSCFISYSHDDKSFARRLHDALQGSGIRCWLDEHELLPGHDLHDEIDRGIRLRDKLLLCCSKSSLSSWWVDKEISTAFDKEQRLMKERGEKIRALIPLNLDGFLFSGDWQSGKATEIKTRLAADFRGWKRNNAKFEKEFERLIKALRTDGGRQSPPESKI